MATNASVILMLLSALRFVNSKKKSDKLHVTIQDGLVKDRRKKALLNFIKSSLTCFQHINLHHVQD